MESTSLIDRYHCLRQDLEKAYRQTVWDSATIDRIANELARLEQVIAGSVAGLRRRQGQRPSRPQNMLP